MRERAEVGLVEQAVAEELEDVFGLGGEAKLLELAFPVAVRRVDRLVVGHRDEPQGGVAALDIAPEPKQMIDFF